MQQNDESLLVGHNIACAVSIIAGIKGIKPIDAGANMEINQIITDAKEVYKYAIWRLNRYDQHTIHDITQYHEKTLWNSKSSDPD